MPKVTVEHQQMRREQILAAALRCFAAEGFHATSMSEVISASGLSAGAVYLYFSGKSELVSAVSERVLEGVEQALSSLVVADPPVSPAEAVRVLLEEVVHMSQAYEVDLSRVGLSAWSEAQRDAQILAIAQRSHSRLREDMRVLLERWRDAGHLPADADVIAGAKVMFGALPGFLVQRLVLGDVSLEDYVAGMEVLSSCPSAPR